MSVQSSQSLSYIVVVVPPLLGQDGTGDSMACCGWPWELREVSYTLLASGKGSKPQLQIVRGVQRRGEEEEGGGRRRGEMRRYQTCVLCLGGS